MSNSRKSDGRNKQTIGGRGPKSLSRQNVSGAGELPKVQRSIGMPNSQLNDQINVDSKQEKQ